MKSPSRTTIAILSAALALALAACDGTDADADGGADADADADADSDGDTDADADSDGDTDADADAGSDAGGDAGADTDADTDALEIIGDYMDDWGSAHSVTAEAWTTTFGDSSSVAHITSYDNGADFLVAQNDETLSYFPSLWSRYDWTYSDDDLYYCQIEYMAEDEETAAANGSADRDDLEAGCGGFSWSALTPD